MENENKVIPTTDSAEILEKESVQEEVIAEMDPSSESKPEEKRCPNCQALLTEEQIFCPECGASFKKFIIYPLSSRILTILSDTSDHIGSPFSPKPENVPYLANS